MKSQNGQLKISSVDRLQSWKEYGKEFINEENLRNKTPKLKQSVEPVEKATSLSKESQLRKTEEQSLK